jgi:hypothetical protein
MFVAWRYCCLQSIAAIIVGFAGTILSRYLFESIEDFRKSTEQHEETPNQHGG